ncbi:MAG: HAD-IA family hydrolase, partial [Candidatus Omnitrophica bacterium]|nr:HAD-IA family hydrolase [Candidatus Omnitrophota bacterium]
DYVLCGDKLKYGKPHPEILLRIIDRLAVKRQEVVYVGDMTVDAQAGKNARVKTVIVTTGSSSPLEIKKERPDLIIKRVADLLNIL